MFSNDMEQTISKESLLFFEADCPKTKNGIEQSTISGVGRKAKKPDDVENEMENRVFGWSVEGESECIRSKEE